MALPILQTGVGHEQRGRCFRQLQRDFGQLADGAARCRDAESHLRDALFGDAVGQQFQSRHLPGQRLLRLRAQNDAGGQANGQCAGAALINPQPDPQTGRINQPQHRLPGHHGAARLRVAAGDDAVSRGQQPHRATLLRQRGALGLLADGVLTAAV